MARRVRGVVGRAAWRALRPKERVTYDHKLELLRLLREGVPQRKAEALAHTRLANSEKYLGPAIRRTRTGKVIVAPVDRLYRRMTVVTPDGPVTVEIRGSRAASIVGRHANAVQTFVQTGDARGLREFRGASVGGHKLAADPDVLRQLARRGELNFEDLYDLTT